MSSKLNSHVPRKCTLRWGVEKILNKTLFWGRISVDTDAKSHEMIDWQLVFGRQQVLADSKSLAGSRYLLWKDHGQDQFHTPRNLLRIPQSTPSTRPFWTAMNLNERQTTSKHAPFQASSHHHVATNIPSSGEIPQAPNYSVLSCQRAHKLLSSNL